MVRVCLVTVFFFFEQIVRLACKEYSLLIGIGATVEQKNNKNDDNNQKNRIQMVLKLAQRTILFYMYLFNVTHLFFVVSFSLIPK